MNILVFSDSHGSTAQMLKVINEKPADFIIHLGDFSKDAESIASQTAKPIIYVAGNCDFYPKAPYEIVTDICGHNVYLCHGNEFYGDENEIAACAKKKDCEIAMFGHTHRPLDTVIGGIRVINPGSIAKPKYPYDTGTYAYLSVDKDKINCNLCKFE